MTLFDIIRNLQAIAAQEPSVRSVSDGDIYDCLNAAVDIKYGVFHITQDTHSTNGDLDVWGLNLFYIDRLLDNGENRLSIQSAGITILENVLKRFADTFGAEYLNNIVYTPFTQRFKDNCAGVFCKISISTVMDNLCEEGGKIVLVKNQDKSIDITSNGRYNVTPDYGYSGLGMVDITVNVPSTPYVVTDGMKFADSTFTTFTAEGLDFSQKTDFTECWSNCDKLTSFPLINTSKGTNFYLAWFDCSSLKSFPLIDTSRGTNFGGAWSQCSSLISFPLIDTSKGTNFGTAWDNCQSLSEFPLIDTSKGTNFAAAWCSCHSLKEFPLIDTSKGTNFCQAWSGCISLTSFPLLNLSSGTDFRNAWRNCYKLTSFPMLDLHNGTNFSQAWSNCGVLTEFPSLDLSAGTSFIEAWYWCSALTTMPALDLSAGTYFNNAWYKCESLTTLGGFGAIKESFSLSSSPNLTVDSLMNVINQAADLNSLGITGKTMTFGSTNLNKLTDAQKSVATSKGWTLA